MSNAVNEPLVLMDTRHRMLLDDYCERRLNELRKLNDAPSTELETAQTRGAIAELKRIQGEVLDRSARMVAAAPEKFA